MNSFSTNTFVFSCYAHYTGLYFAVHNHISGFHDGKWRRQGTGNGKRGKRGGGQIVPLSFFSLHQPLITSCITALNKPALAWFAWGCVPMITRMLLDARRCLNLVSSIVEAKSVSKRAALTKLIGRDQCSQAGCYHQEAWKDRQLQQTAAQRLERVGRRSRQQAQGPACFLDTAVTMLKGWENLSWAKLIQPVAS